MGNSIISLQEVNLTSRTESNSIQGSKQEFGAIQGQKGAKMRFQALFSFKMYQILPILHMMIQNNSIQYLIVVKALKLILLAQKWAFQGQKGAKMGFQAIFLFKMHQFLPILYFMIASYDIQQLVVAKVLKKNLLALKWAQLGPKRGQNEVLGHFLFLSSFVLAEFAYYD